MCSEPELLAKASPDYIVGLQQSHADALLVNGVWRGEQKNRTVLLVVEAADSALETQETRKEQKQENGNKL